MKFRVAIVEDEQNHAKHLRGLVEKFAREKGEDIDVVHYTDGDEIASDYKADCDVILFDILMARMNGMDAARYIRKMDKEVVILFITTIAQFAIEGYGVGARGYLLKPVAYADLCRELQGALEEVRKKQKQRILIPTEGGWASVSLAEVCYIESMRHFITVWTDSRGYTFKSSLIDIEKKLPSELFFRCNNCYIVNLARVRKVTGNRISVDPYEVIVSRPREKAFTDALLNFYSRGGRAAL